MKINKGRAQLFFSSGIAGLHSHFTANEHQEVNGYQSASWNIVSGEELLVSW